MKLKPRPYQAKALKAMAEHLIIQRTTDSGIVVLPTGAGKTFVGSYFNTEVVKQLGYKVIWCAHRDELIRQAKEAHERAVSNAGLNIKMTEWTANKKDASGDFIFTSIQSTRGLVETIEALYSTGTKNIVLAIDECHHFAAPDAETNYTNMYADLFMGLHASNLLAFCYGLTATAERLDGKPLGFKKVIYQMKFTDGVREGFLARPIYYEMRTRQEFHLDSTKKANGKSDYTDQDLKQLDNKERNDKIASEYIRHKQWRTNKDGSFKLDDKGKKIHGWGKTLIFAVNVSHCYSIASSLKKQDPTLDVRVVTGGTSETDRKEFKDWLAEGDKHTPKVAVNCLVFTEGFDEPTINTIFLTRPTKSESLWMQMVGRGARIIRCPLSGRVIKSTFNLVSVMDEIGRYGALVKDWSLSLLDGNHVRVIKQKRNRKSKARAKRKLMSRIFETQGVKQGELSDAELIDVQAILIYGTQISHPEGIPLDKDRIDCFRLLKEYLQTCFYKEQDKNGSWVSKLDIDAFRNSYGHCVPANEFDHDTWRKVAWSYYFRYVRKLKVIRNKISGKTYPVWKLVPMVAVDTLDSKEAVEAAEKRLTTVKENSARKNEEFNLKYGGRSGTRKLYERVLDTLAKKAKQGDGDVMFITKNVARIICKDRLLEVKLKISIDESKTGRSHEKLINSLSRRGTQVLQEYLQDSVAEFRVSPAISKD